MDLVSARSRRVASAQEGGATLGQARSGGVENGGGFGQDCRNSVIPARAWHHPGQPIRAQRPATEWLTGGSHSSVNFPYLEILENRFLHKTNRYKARKNLKKFVGVGNLI
jgi:hypothetical protein